MDDHQSAGRPPGTMGTWDGVRRVREPLAWTLLALAAVGVAVSAWQLFGLPGGSVAPATPRPVAVVTGAPVPAGQTPAPVLPAPHTVSGTGFGVRAAVVAPQFASGGIFTALVLAVVLAVFAGGVTERARQVDQVAVLIEAAALGLGLLSWLFAFSAHLRPGAWFIFDAADLAAVGAALVFTVAVLRSRALRPPAPAT